MEVKINSDDNMVTIPVEDYQALVTGNDRFETLVFMLVKTARYDSSRVGLDIHEGVLSILNCWAPSLVQAKLEQLMEEEHIDDDF